MKVLFVSSGNTAFGISPITINQGNSLIKCGLSISYFPIQGKGLKNYVKSIIPLKRHLTANKYDIIHAHYSKAAIIASLANAKPLVVSLMGSDSKTSFIFKFFIKIFNRLFWNHVIVKSVDMQKSLMLKDVSIIPNGVNTDVFFPMDKITCQKMLGWASNKKHILFAAKPSRPEKNFNLAQRGVELLKSESIELHSLVDVQPSQIPIWLNAADVVLLTSLWEGSPNVIKEAMACNRPIVSTDVGDVSWIFSNTPGCYISSNSSEDLSDKLSEAIQYSSIHNRTNGRDCIEQISLDSKSIALKIIAIYNSLISKPKYY